MSYCTIEEAWGGDFGRPVSGVPSSNVSRGPHYRYSFNDGGGSGVSGFGSSVAGNGDVGNACGLGGSGNANIHNASFGGALKEQFSDPSQNSIFAGNEDQDLLNNELLGASQHDEFNIPLKTASSAVPAPYKASSSSLDDYYQLLDSADNGNGSSGDLDKQLGKYEEEIQYRLKQNNSNGKGSGKETEFCKRLIKHVRECKLCRAQLIAELELEEILSLKEEQEVSKNAANVDIMDLVLFIAAGIFLIFIMDSFVKIGKIMKG